LLFGLDDEGKIVHEMVIFYICESESFFSVMAPELRKLLQQDVSSNILSIKGTEETLHESETFFEAPLSLMKDDGLNSDDMMTVPMLEPFPSPSASIYETDTHVNKEFIASPLVARTSMGSTEAFILSESKKLEFKSYGILSSISEQVYFQWMNPRLKQILSYF
jgi:hypothetical protein